jgi:hypothetical protein
MENPEECQTEGHQMVVQEMQNEDCHLQEVQKGVLKSQDGRQTEVHLLMENQKALAPVHYTVAHY